MSRYLEESIKEFMGSNYQTTKIAFTNFLPNFFSVCAIEKTNKLLIGSLQFFSQFVS